MTIHVNIREIETRLPELIAAMDRGEEVVLDKEGEPQARLVAVSRDNVAEVQRRSAKRKAAIGMFKHLVDGRDIDILQIKADDRRDEHYGRKFADID